MVDNLINMVLLGDCLELFRQIPDNSIDVTFADPPFNLKKKYNSYKDKLSLEDYLNWCDKWIFQMVRVTKPEGSIFLHNIPKWLTHYSGFLNKYAYFKHWISWDSPTSPMGKSLQPSHYGILFYTKSEKGSKFYEVRYPHKRDRRTGYLSKDYGGKKETLHPFGPLVSDVWTDIHRIKHNKFRDEHPCQLPIHLLERIILMSTNVDAVILDPFMGTGTSAIAAKKLGRKFIGFELDENYVNVANSKIASIVEESKIGKSYVSMYLDDIATLRDVDWQDLEQFFVIPSSMKDIDHTKTVLKKELRNSKRAQVVEKQDLELFNEINTNGKHNRNPKLAV